MNSLLGSSGIRLAGAVSLGVVLLAVGGCGRAAGPAGKAAAPAVPVQVAQVLRQTLPRTQISIGAVQSLRTVTVKSQIDGVIKEIHFREGDDVQAGDPLVTLDRRPFENALRMARADLANARAEAVRAQNDATRYQRLDQQEAVSKEQLATLLTKAETTKALMQAKEAAVANAELQLSYAEIRAPIAGRTGQRNLHEGALVKANDATTALVTINQIAPVAVAYNVPEGVLGALRTTLAAGAVPVTVVTRDPRPRTVVGRLDFIDNTVDPATGTILIKAIFDNTDRALWPGQFLDVATQLGADADALLVPTSAVQTGQQGSQIFVVKPDQTVELRSVQVVRSAGGLAMIRDGVRVGETVVTDGQLRLVPGARVEVRSLEAAAKPPAGDAPKGAAGQRSS